jgi:hypothetical protein
MQGQLAVRYTVIQYRQYKCTASIKAGRRKGRAAIRGPAVTVAPRRQRGNGRRQGRRPLQLQNTRASGGGGRYIKLRAAKKTAVAVTPPLPLPVQKAGGRYYCIQAAVTGSGRRPRWRWRPLQYINNALTALRQESPNIIGLKWP